MRRQAERVQDLIAWLIKTLLPFREKQVKQTKVAQQLTYFGPPDAEPSGVRVPR